MRRQEGDDLPSAAVIGTTPTELSKRGRITQSGDQLRSDGAVYPRIVEDIQQIEEDVAAFGDDPVFRWRLERLEQAGYDQCSALELAGRWDVDLHFALNLREQGCPADTAARILN